MTEENSTSQSKPNIPQRPTATKQSVKPERTIRRSQTEFQLPERPLAVWLTLAGFFLAICLLIGLMRPWVRISQVKVDANGISPTEISRAAQVKKGMWRWEIFGQKDAIAKRAMNHDHRIKKMDVKMDADVLSLKVVENIRVGYVKRQDGWYLLNTNGKPVRRVSQRQATLPFYNGFKSQTQLSRVIKQYTQLDFSVRQVISQVEWSPTKDNAQRVVLYLTDGNEVYANADSFAKKMKYYPGMAAAMKKPGVVDLQVGAYSRPYTYADNVPGHHEEAIN